MKITPPNSVPPRMALYIFLLGVSLVVLGAAGCYVVYRLDRAYSFIIRGQLPALADMRDLSKRSDQANRLLLSIPRGAKPEVVARRMGEIQKLRDQNSGLISGLVELQLGGDVVPLTGKLVAIRNNYRQAVDRYVAKLPADLSDEDFRQERQMLAQFHDTYMQAQERLADEIEALAARRNTEISRNSRWAIITFLGIALWPALIGLGLVLFGLLRTLVLFNDARKVNAPSAT